MNRWAGPVLTLAILSMVAGVLFWNLETPGGSPGPPPPAPEVEPGAAIASVPTTSRGVVTSGGFREYPIGETEREQMEIAAVWLPAIHMEGQDAGMGNDVIHLEADIHALQEHPNGFALGEFIPYLTVHYSITPKAGGTPITGTMIPMIARDGLHYGVSLARPAAGDYVLSYKIEPPSSGGLGRHDDPLTGVSPWWPPFEVTFDWHFEPPPAS